MFSKGPVKGPRRRGRAYYTIIANSSTVTTTITVIAITRIITPSPQIQKLPNEPANKYKRLVLLPPVHKFKSSQTSRQTNINGSYYYPQSTNSKAPKRVGKQI